MLLLVLGCTPAPAPPPKDESPDPVDTADAHTGGPVDTGPVGHSGDASEHTGGPPGDPCLALVSAPLSKITINVETTEDFDFDAQARLVYADWSGNLVVVDDTGDTSLLSPGDFSNDARGIQVLSTGEILVNYISAGKVVKVDPYTGARSDVITNVNGPNALEIGDGDTVYLTETGTGRVLMFDSVLGTRTTIAEGFSYPNGLALSQDQLTLYVSDDAAGIYAMTRSPGGVDWSAPRLVFDPAPGEAYDAMEVDICGNLYSMQFYSGKLYRYDPVTDTGVQLANLQYPGDFLWNAIRWGSDRGGWRRDTLYVTSRDKIFGLELGVPGRDQPVDALPF